MISSILVYYNEPFFSIAKYYLIPYIILIMLTYTYNRMTLEAKQLTFQH